MPKHLIGCAVLGAALTSVSLAMGAGRRTFVQRFATGAGAKATTKRGRPTAGFLAATWSEPVASVDDVLPAGARLDTSAPASCTATDSQIARSGGAVCPAASTLGSGHAALRLAGKGSPDIPATVVAFNCRRSCGSRMRRNQLILYLSPAGGNAQILRARVRKGSLRLPLPVLCAPVGTRPACGPGGNVRMVSLDLAIGRVVGKRGTGYLTTPASCPRSRRWSFTLRLHGRDGRTRTKTSGSPC